MKLVSESGAIFCFERDILTSVVFISQYLQGEAASARRLTTALTREIL